MSNTSNEELTDEETERQDFVDNAIFDLIQQLNPSGKELEWDINIISHVREAIQHCLVDKLKLTDEYTFYPYRYIP